MHYTMDAFANPVTYVYYCEAYKFNIRYDRTGGYKYTVCAALQCLRGPDTKIVFVCVSISLCIIHCYSIELSSRVTSA